MAGDGPGLGKPPTLAMLDDQIHLWLFSLAASPTASAAQAKLLSGDETARADRFHFARDRVGFIAGRASLRRILGHYLEADPAALAFSYGPAGKPDLRAPSGGKAVKFNLSHSAGWALLAVTRGRELGVDLERLRVEADLAAVARRFFAPAEFQALAAFAPPLDAQAFCACWTRKEALLKAFGAGLSLPLDGFCVSIDPRQPARLISTGFRPEEARRWSLADVRLDPPLAQDFRAALAVEGPLPELRTFRLGDLATAGINPPSGSTSEGH
jgi:4'-phosphopantetheinyl transferase